RLGEDGLHQRTADAVPPRRRDDTEAADPAALAADAEQRDTFARRDSRTREVDVPGGGHVLELRRVDAERHDVPLIAGVEELRELVDRERVGSDEPHAAT